MAQTDAEILADTQRLIEAYHDGSAGSMTQVVVAPCSPFSVTTDIMRDSAALARSLGVTTDTHLAETMDEEEFCIATYGRRPIELMEISTGWATMFGSLTACLSTMRKSAGWPTPAPVSPTVRRPTCGSPPGSLRCASTWRPWSHRSRRGRIRQQRRQPPPRRGSSGDAAAPSRPWLAGGGQAADFIAMDLGRLEYAGALHDPVAAAMLCAPVNVDFNFVGGEAVVAEGHLVSTELEPLIEQHNRLAGQLLE